MKAAASYILVNNFNLFPKYWTVGRNSYEGHFSSIQYTVWVKNPPQFSDIFPKRLGIFNKFFYTLHTPITRSNLH